MESDLSELNPSSRLFKSRQLFSGILAFGLALRLFYFVGVSGYDDVDYFKYVLQVLDGTFSTAAVSDGSFPFRFRIGVIFPTALMFRVFGTSEYVAAVLPLLSSMGLIWLSWWGGRRISEATGLTAAFLMATFPLAIGQSTTLMPGPFAAFFSALAVLFWLYTEDAEQRGETGTAIINGRYLLSGIFLGLGYFYRIEVGLFVLFFVGFTLVHRRAWRGCFLALSGAAAVVVLENVVYWSLHGELLYRLKVVSGGFAGLDEELSDFVAAKKSVFVYLKAMFLKPTELGLHWAALLPASVCCLFLRREHRIPILLWFWPVTLYLFFGSWSLSSYVPTTKNPRYLISVSVPGIILAASLIDQFRASGKVKRLTANFCFIGVTAGSLILMNLVYVYLRENASGSRVAAQYILQQEAVSTDNGVIHQEAGPIWCGHHGALALRCFLPDHDIRPVFKHDISFGLSRVDVQPDELTSGIVVVDRFLIDKYARDTGMEPPQYLLDPPEHWAVMFEAPHPTGGFAYSVVRQISRLTAGRLSGPQNSLQTSPVTIYAPHLR